MVLSHTKLHEFRANIPDLWRTLEKARNFRRQLDPLGYHLMWGAAFVFGASTLLPFATLGALFKFSDLTKSIGEMVSLNPTLVVIGVVAVILYQLASVLLSDFVQYRRSVLGLRIAHALDQEEINLLNQLDVARLTDPAFIELRGMATEWIGRSALDDLMDIQYQTVGAIAGLLTSLGIIAILDPLFVILVVPPVIFEIIASIKKDSMDRSLYLAQFDANRLSYTYRDCLMRVRFLLQGKFLRFYTYWRERYDELKIDMQQGKLNLEKRSLKLELLKDTVKTLMLAIVFIYLGHGIVNGSVVFSDIFFYWGSMQTLGGSLSSFAKCFTRIREERINYSYREQFLATKPLVTEDKARANYFRTIPTLELRNVSFRYPRTSAVVLSNCSLSIAPGERVALVGKNGSGKTTLFRLMAKVFEPDEGQVLIGGIPTQHISQASWWEQLVCCTQDTDIPELTIEEALMGARPGTINYERLQRAVDFAGASQIIKALQNGYQTKIGADWKDGWQPSTGQEQRLKLASAFGRILEPQVRIGIFDEPMSQCDIETRALFYESLARFCDKTIIVIAHDPVYLHCFNRVILIEGGTVARDMRTAHEIQIYQREAIPEFNAV